MSLIYKITDDVRYANTIVRPFYPAEWLIPTIPPGKGTGATNAGDGGHPGNGTPGKGGQREQGPTARGRNMPGQTSMDR